MGVIKWRPRYIHTHTAIVRRDKRHAATTLTTASLIDPEIPDRADIYAC